MPDNLDRENVTAADLKNAVADLRREMDTRLEHVMDRLLTAVFGFVKGANARMEELESSDPRLSADNHALELRLEALERGWHCGT